MKVLSPNNHITHNPTKNLLKSPSLSSSSNLSDPSLLPLLNPNLDPSLLPLLNPNLDPSLLNPNPNLSDPSLLNPNLDPSDPLTDSRNTTITTCLLSSSRDSNRYG